MSEIAQWVLASASPRRLTLLTGAGFPVVVRDPGDVEDGVDAPTVRETALARARAKVAAIPLAPGALVIAADTIVEHDGAALGKPRDRADARAILARLSGQTHRIVTGVALRWNPGDARTHAFAETTTVTFRALTDAEIAAYVDSGESDGKAGAYAIQETGERFVAALEGSYTNVVGFPVERFVAELRSLGISAPADGTAAAP